MAQGHIFLSKWEKHTRTYRPIPSTPRRIGRWGSISLFSLSLTGTAFAWYVILPPNSINSWNDLESKFHEHFFSGEYELGLVDLASVQQGREESVNDYIWRFWDTRKWCFRIHVADKELEGLAFNGLLSYLRDKLNGT
jgi:hypothetical protein